MSTFRERLDAANNARAIEYACGTEAARQHADRKWREFIEAEERAANEAEQRARVKQELAAIGVVVVPEEG